MGENSLSQLDAFGKFKLPETSEAIKKLETTPGCPQCEETGNICGKCRLLKGGMLQRENRVRDVVTADGTIVDRIRATNHGDSMIPDEVREYASM